VTVELTVEVGRTRMQLGETMSLGPGSVVTLDRLADKPVDLLVNGRPIARGEVVVIDEQFGLRITEVVGAERPAGAAPAAGFTPELAAAPPIAELPEAA
jgi:flagellar motor switch protein FliN/FliY